PDGSSNVREIEISPDGKWAYAAHTRGRPALPTTQLDRGWVNTNAMSIIDLEKKELYTTILLDLLTKGAADPWGVAVSPDGKDAWVSISGTHEVARLDLDRLHKYLEGGFELAEGQEIDPYSGSAEMIWSELKENPAKRLDLVNNLAVLHGADLMKRFEIKGSRGLRGLDISPDGQTLAVASYFTGEAIMLKPESMEPTRKISLGKQPEMTMARRGEKIFFDGNYCFQSWLSCGSCHADGRVDGLNWDLLNDGIGNPKNAKSLLWSHKTPPVMSLGVRASMEVATQKGFEFIQFTTVEEDDLEAVHAYLRSMEPEASPYLVNGKLSEKAEKGKKIFESREVGCSNCHPAPLFTDLQMYDVGTRHELDREDAFDNPTLVEMWRSGPYLHDGSATSIYQLFKEMNPEDKHGKTSHLSDEELRALEEYVLSL
ncbi:MAG: cell surface protein, partial [Candidatus Sumerlaeota bacterium]